ncbi:MAG: threonine-phosphate decarboxylase [Nitrospirae bacterium]|nr:threonine-phosphate decarboxylase [Nitrospirota bacterium]MBF0542284.1 threonine-phosphate decarboxylase [Nitrospirota bacterium]
MPGHGGNIYEASRQLKIPERKIIDFSASINPLGTSKKVRAELRRYLKYLTNYPDPDCIRLRWSLNKELNVPIENILCGNGSTEIIYLIVSALKPKKVLLLAPTFSEYERAIKLNSGINSIIKYYDLKSDDNFAINVDEFIASMDGCDMAFLCNPNNPTGKLLIKEDVIKISKAALLINCTLVIDEAFIDFAHEQSVTANVVNNPNLIVIRSLTKFYALSGLRIGYGVMSKDVIEEIYKIREPWTVNTLAQRAAVVALNDWVYRKKTFDLLGAEKSFLEAHLFANGIKYFPSDSNFILAKSDHTETLIQRFLLKGIIVRDCSNFRGLNNSFFRIAVRTHRENAMLVKSIYHTMKSL